MHKSSTTIAHFVKTEDTVILNLNGTGCKVYVIPPNTILFQNLAQTANKLNMPLQQAILDAEFFKRINNNKFKNISSISQFAVEGLMLDEKAQVEIRVNARKKRKILLTELLKHELLFPNYNVDMQPITINAGSLIVVEKEKGLIAGFKLFIQKLDLDKMNFTFSETQIGNEKLILLSLISYDGKILSSNVRDTVVTSNYAVFATEK